MCNSGGLASHPGNYVPEGSFNDDYEVMCNVNQKELGYLFSFQLMIL